MTMQIEMNKNFSNLKDDYLFEMIAEKVDKYKLQNPEKKIISLGIGDCTLPLSSGVIKAMHQAVEEMAHQETFRGYSSARGYAFLRQAVVKDYRYKGVELENDEVFISDGAKSDIGNIFDLLGDNQVLIPNPVYPVYLDCSLMAGVKVKWSVAKLENQFLPSPKGLEFSPKIVILCSPNNPTGTTYNYDQLKEWIDYALRSGSLLLFDAAYEAFVQDDLPHSIYQIEGAKNCAIEIGSLSKSAGFTGVRCSWMIVPKNLMSQGMSLYKMWSRRQATKFNGVGYIVQRAAEAALSEQGKKESRQLIEYYHQNAVSLASCLKKKGIFFTGGESSPYLWMKCPESMNSWKFFDQLLNKIQVIVTPGIGFGNQGEGYVRLSCFTSHEECEEAVSRLNTLL